MADILHMVPIEAPPGAVYRALTTADGLRSWWTRDAEAESSEGSEARFRFEGGEMEMRFRVDRLQEGESVGWSVLEPAPPEWNGTRVTFELTPSEGGTNLLFGHRDWASSEGSLPAISYNWSYYLTSLKQYLEEGEGFPHPG